MPAPTKRRPKGAIEPAKKADVPEYLSKGYGIRFSNGQPDIPGFGAALARAESLLAAPEFAWLEELARLTAALAVTVSAIEARRIKAKVRKAKRAIRAGAPYPHLATVALSEFLITLDIWHPRDPKEGDLQGRKSLPFGALCVLAWWRGLLTGNPFDEDVQREAQDLMKRRWQ